MMKPWASGDIIDKTFRVWRFSVRIHWRDGKGLMGRFGGGWRFKLGVSIGDTTVLFNLLFFSISVSYRLKEVA